jgi:hypothetical protein
MKRLGILILVGIFLGLNCFVPANSATIKAGTACNDLATIKNVNGQKFYCSYVLKTNTNNWQKVIPVSNKVKKGSTFYVYFNAASDCITDGASDFDYADEVRLSDIVGGKDVTALVSTTWLYTREGGCSLGAEFTINKNLIGNQVAVYHVNTDSVIAVFEPTKNCKCAINVKAKTNPQDAILNQPAANFFLPGNALVTLQQVWGVKINSASGPKTFRQVADEIYLYLCRSVGRKVTQSDLEIGFQYGNSMQSFFSRLIDNVWAYQAMKDRLIYNSNL